MKIQIIPVPLTHSKTRLDKFLVYHIHNITRENVQNLIKHGLVKVDGVVAAKSGINIVGKKEIEVTFPFRQEVEIIPQPEIPVEVVYEDEDMIVVNKPAGLVVHPAPGNWDGTLVNALFGKHIQKTGFAEKDSLRIGLVHRLDKDTSGIIIIATNDRSKAFLSDQFKDRKVSKTYLALVHGTLQPRKGRIEAPIGRDPRDRKKMAVVSVLKGGKEAITDYEVLSYPKPGYTLVAAHPLTGRTHQIRVHFTSIGHPLVADSTYTKKENDWGITRQALHAWKLEIALVNGSREEFIAPPPDFFPPIPKETKSE